MTPEYLSELHQCFMLAVEFISSWRVPEKFESAEAARNKIISDVLEFIKLYCTKDRCDLVMGWLKQY